MSPSKLAGAIKHPVWISVATVVGILALVVTYFQTGGDSFQTGGDSTSADLEIAAVSFGDPTAIDAEIGAAGELTTARGTEAATPIDITLKNNGGTSGRIVGVETKVLHARSIDCSKQGGASVVSAYYGVKLPLNWGMAVVEDVAPPEAVSTSVDYTVKPGSVDRMEVTVGPEEIGNGSPMVLAVQLRLVPEQGDPIEVQTLAVSQPNSVQQTIDRGMSFWSDKHCVQESSDFLNTVFNATGMQSPDVVQLRDAVEGLLQTT